MPHDKKECVGPAVLRLRSRKQISSPLRGVTNDLERRVFEHKQKLIPGFTAEYDIDRLIYFESTPDVLAAIQREKQLKGWKTYRKVALIESVNPHWEDLSFRRADEETPRRKARDPSLRSG